jgi:hypothetical protein
MRTMVIRNTLLLSATLSLFAAEGCQTLNSNKGKGAAIGAAGGAVAGAVIPGLSVGEGAAIGAVGGATVRAIHDSNHKHRHYHSNNGHRYWVDHHGHRHYD